MNGHPHAPLSAARENTGTGTSKNRETKPRDYALKPRGFTLKPRGFTLKPRDSVLKPQGFTLQTRDYTLKPQGFILKPRGYILKPRGFTLKPRDSETPPPPHSLQTPAVNTQSTAHYAACPSFTAVSHSRKCHAGKPGSEGRDFHNRRPANGRERAAHAVAARKAGLFPYRQRRPALSGSEPTAAHLPQAAPRLPAVMEITVNSFFEVLLNILPEQDVYPGKKHPLHSVASLQVCIFKKNGQGEITNRAAYTTENLRPNPSMRDTKQSGHCEARRDGARPVSTSPRPS
ncbi:MAG: hypothetical protein LBJ23_00820 [Tannerella sp.]|jgi:hypothetical protein|nr:hypothetical protein [Tannerella sp.]